MWTDAQLDGRLAEYRWRPLFSAAVWLTPTTGVPCSNAAKTRNPLKLDGVHHPPPKLPDRSQPLVGRSLPYWRHCCWTSFFPIVDTCLSCEHIYRQSRGMVCV